MVTLLLFIIAGLLFGFMPVLGVLLGVAVAIRLVFMSWSI